jgi:Flp pilus assembly protein TadG
MPKPASIYRRFITSTRGVAAIEFAMILPVLLILFLASFDGGRAIAVDMKVRSATYALAAITNQYTTIQSTDMTSIVGATSVVLAPYSSAPVVVKISQLTISASGKATVSWSYSLNGTARALGSTVTIPSALATPNSYLIFGEVSYTYTPLFGYFGSGGIALSDNLYVTPRSSNCINYPPQSVTSCT